MTTSHLAMEGYRQQGNALVWDGHHKRVPLYLRAGARLPIRAGGPEEGA